MQHFTSWSPSAPSARHRTADPARLSVVDSVSAHDCPNSHGVAHQVRPRQRQNGRRAQAHPTVGTSVLQPIQRVRSAQAEAPDHPKVLLVLAEREGSTVHAAPNEAPACRSGPAPRRAAGRAGLLGARCAGRAQCRRARCRPGSRGSARRAPERPLPQARAAGAAGVRLRNHRVSVEAARGHRGRWRGRRPLGCRRVSEPPLGVAASRRPASTTGRDRGHDVLERRGRDAELRQARQAAGRDVVAPHQRDLAARQRGAGREPGQERQGLP